MLPTMSSSRTGRLTVQHGPQNQQNSKNECSAQDGAREDESTTLSCYYKNHFLRGQHFVFSRDYFLKVCHYLLQKSSLKISYFQSTNSFCFMLWRIPNLQLKDTFSIATWLLTKTHKHNIFYKQSFKTCIPLGGQTAPISTVGAKLEWKNAQKKAKKHNLRNNK